MYLTKRFNAMPPDMVDMVWDMLPPSLRVGVEDKYEVLQGGVTVSEEYSGTVNRSSTTYIPITR